jgi:transcriptional regulator with GAF, ATPase, and Fis domain
MGSDFGGIGTRSLRDQRGVRVRRVEIVVESGPDAGRRIRLGDGVVRVGTAKGSDLRLADPTVSRIHCDLSLREDGVRVVDTGSTNGTFVGGTRIREADLTSTASLVIGSSSLLVHIGDESVELDVPARDSFGPLIGASPAMRRVYAIVEQVARSDISVLVTGETGTGKELVARAIHDASPRARGPFVVLDCAALPPSLVESELFGHTRGAFSGAVADRAGVFEEARGGTLFIDEVGELPVALQPKLLRALESRTVKPVGSNRVIHTDARIVAATNRSLADEVNRGTFREDLYYRLAAVEIRLPALRERGGDVAVLARAFWERATNGAKMPASLVSTVTGRGWPGNVRELRNFVERTAALAAHDAGRSHDPPDALAAPLDACVRALLRAGLPFKEARRRWTAAYVEGLLDRTGGNVTHAAQLGGISRRFLQRLIERQGATGDDE